MQGGGEEEDADQSEPVQEEQRTECDPPQHKPQPTAQPAH